MIPKSGAATSSPTTVVPPDHLAKGGVPRAAESVYTLTRNKLPAPGNAAHEKDSPGTIAGLKAVP